jgi:hypothetical protein
MQIAGWLDTGKNERLEGGHDVSLACGGPFGHDPEAPGWTVESCMWKPRMTRLNEAGL